jgi:two-component system, chemotaxis family, chemotaxis protein CheY
MRVLIVDDSTCFRQAARALLERRGYDVVGEAGGADAAVEAVAGLAPDAVLLDILLPDGTGFGVCAEITAARPAPAVLLMSSEDFGTCFSLAEQCGARGFVLKSSLGQCELDRFFGEPQQA